MPQDMIPCYSSPNSGATALELLETVVPDRSRPGDVLSSRNKDTTYIYIYIYCICLKDINQVLIAFIALKCHECLLIFVIMNSFDSYHQLC